MTNSENLLERITRIAEAGATYKQGRRILANNNSAAILPAILQEIDETILARELTFYSDTGDSITLIAKGRRLWRICAAKPKSLIPKGAELVSVNLSDSDKDEMSALAKLMQKFSQTTKSLSVSISEADPDSDYSAMGISVRKLRDTWDVSAMADSPKDVPAKADSPNSLQEFVEKLSGNILASVVVAEDNLISSSGTDGQIKLLQDLIKEQLVDMDAEFNKLQKKVSSKRLVALSRDSNHFIICARMGNQAALIVCKPDEMSDIVSTWQQVDR